MFKWLRRIRKRPAVRPEHRWAKVYLVVDYERPIAVIVTMQDLREGFQITLDHRITLAVGPMGRALRIHFNEEALLDGVAGIIISEFQVIPLTDAELEDMEARGEAHESTDDHPAVGVITGFGQKDF